MHSSSALFLAIFFSISSVLGEAAMAAPSESIEPPSNATLANTFIGIGNITYRCGDNATAWVIEEADLYHIPADSVTWNIQQIRESSNFTQRLADDLRPSVLRPMGKFYGRRLWDSADTTFTILNPEAAAAVLNVTMSGSTPAPPDQTQDLDWRLWQLWDVSSAWSPSTQGYAYVRMNDTVAGMPDQNTTAQCPDGIDSNLFNITFAAAFQLYKSPYEAS